MRKEIEKLEIKLSNTTDIKEKVDTLIALIAILKEVDPHRSLELCQRAIELATTGQFESEPYQKGFTLALIHQGSVFSILGDTSQAMKSVSHAISILTGTNDLYGLTKALNLFGIIYMNLGDFHKALSYSLEALNMARENQNAQQEAAILSNLGHVYNRLGDIKKELEVYNQALKLVRGDDKDKMTSIIFNNIAMAYHTQKRYAKALEAAQKSLRISQDIGVRLLETNVLCTIGDIYLDMSSYAKAVEYFQKSMMLAQETGDRFLEMLTLFSSGKLYSEQKNLKKAISYLQQALKLAQELKSKPELSQIHKTLAQVYKSQGKFELALDHYESFHVINEEVFNYESNSKIRNLKILHETEDALKKAETYQVKNTELEEMVAERTFELEQANIQIIQAYDKSLEGWAKALELRHNDTLGHTMRVVDLTMKLAIKMGISDDELIHIRRGALLHDIGKLAIPDRILNKKGPLSKEEMTVMQKHPEYSQQLLTPIEFLHPALDIPKYHHEKWNGSGYPFGLKEDEIPLAARIFAVVDVWDALCFDRPYQKAWEKKTTLEYILSEAGTHFDPEVVKVFIDMAEKNEL
ncbi:MAG: tetratricopeptide repeat protein [Chloroflexi bacterium]|nr:tetratricopeptide repeat protein [Chloroflexota bacterium]